MEKKVTLPKKLIDKLINSPETGMGYQTVDIELNDGTILNDVTIVNCAYLLNVNIDPWEIKDIFIK